MSSKNFRISESDENCYIEFQGHYEHEYIINFVITIILNTILTLITIIIIIIIIIIIMEITTIEIINV